MQSTAELPIVAPEHEPAEPPSPQQPEPERPLGLLQRLATSSVYLWVLVAIGVGLRIRQWWFDRSIWSDEAAVALQFIQDSYVRLAHPLDGNQGAPWGWLWLERLFTQVVGISERSLRLVPLISGILALVFAALIARRILRPLAGCVALAILAVVEPLVYYSNDVKQYSTDAAAVSGVFLLMVVVLDKGCRGRWLAVFGVGSAVAVICSQPAIFAVAIASAIIVVQTWRRFGLGNAALVVAASLGWIAAFGAEYFVDLRNLRSNQQLQTFWQKQYPPKGANAGQVFSWLGHALVGLTSNPIGLPVAWLVISLFILGLLRLAVRQSASAIFVILLLVVACLAAILRVFPLGNRLALYLDVPVVLTLCAAAGPRVAPRRRKSRAALVWRRLELLASVGLAATITVLATAPIQGAADAAEHPYLTVESRPAIQFILSHPRPGAAIYIEGYDMEAATYYHSTLHFPIDGSFKFTPVGDCSTEPAIRLMRSTPWVWLLFGYPPRVTRSKADTIRLNELRLAGLGPIVLRFTGPGHGVSAALVETRPANHGPTGRLLGGCVQAMRVAGLH